MKKGILIMLGLLLMTSTTEAKKIDHSLNRFDINYYAYNNAVNFFENGIEFFVFPNGDFDFDVHFNNRRVRIDRDFRGRIRRIGNVRLRYDFRGNVTRIGSIRLNYFRNRLTNVGDLRVRYDRWGYPNFYGNVRNFYYDNGVRFSVNFGDICDYNDPFFFRNDFRRSYTQFREDRNFFYYKARPNARIGERSRIIKRRKPSTIRGNNNNLSRRNSNSVYRKDNTKRRSSLNNSKLNNRRGLDADKNIKKNSNYSYRKEASKNNAVIKPNSNSRNKEVRTIKKRNSKTTAVKRERRRQK